ncbi:PucR family transcriptional regulator [Pontibacillus litoralis]|uniref:PucR C-terminal helix-turn-helix domain-containing protein n=1 Tax=Pontibacillus litoralis JSM 072002 TaxID=1385512 RepID=A0A0A5G2B8_9BACI|nr:helix-turn-helix domain-containing protein [Pontibacillus litoralis]KGX85293.1 hypothetical protein N784_09640 [Pontibacillus litoralis JSM 072002]
MTLEALRAIYPDMIHASTSDQQRDSQYRWYKTESGQLIGFPLTSLNEKETKLLSTFLTVADVHSTTLTYREQCWYNWIYKSEGNNPIDSKEPLPNQFRYIFFSLENGEELDVHHFQEAMQSIFPKRMPLLWLNKQQGFIIEEWSAPQEERYTFEHIIDVLMSDFLITLQLYISPYYEATAMIQTAYRWGERCFKLACKKQTKRIAMYQDVIPMLYTSSLAASDSEFIVHTILEKVREDEALLHTVKVFLSCNSNATLAAKQLYMHRNSLQYRIDKFIRKTGVDVRKFQGASITYLALMHRQ